MRAGVKGLVLGAVKGTKEKVGRGDRGGDGRLGEETLVPIKRRMSLFSQPPSVKKNPPPRPVLPAAFSEVGTGTSHPQDRRAGTTVTRS